MSAVDAGHPDVGQGVDTRRRRASPGVSPAKRRDHRRVRSSGSAGRQVRRRQWCPAPHRGRARPRSRAAVWSIHFCMNDDHIARTSGLVARAAWPASVTARCAPNAVEERVDTVAPDCAAIVGQRRSAERLASPCRPRDDAVEQRQQHRVLGREVEVERRPRQTRRPWRGRRRRCRRTAAPAAVARPSPGSPARGRHPTGVWSGGRGSAGLTGGSSRHVTLHGVEFLDRPLTDSTLC